MLNITDLTKGLDLISYIGIDAGIDSAKNSFSKWIAMDRKSRTARTRAYNKLRDHDRHSMIPDKKRDKYGNILPVDKRDKYKQKNFNIRNVFIYYHEAMTTPCTLYCNKLTARDKYDWNLPYTIFYKIGITATRHAKRDATDLEKIEYRMKMTRKDFQKRNGGLLQDTLFVVHSNAFNCVLLEFLFHSSIVFNGAISKIFRYFGGITECSKYLDFDMIDRLHKKSSFHNELNDKELCLKQEQFFKRYNVTSFQELNKQQQKDFTEMSDRYKLNKYEWKIINKEEINNIRGSHKRVVKAYQNTLDLISFQNWIRLYNSQSSQSCLNKV